jgi:hypothetical protein
MTNSLLCASSRSVGNKNGLAIFLSGMPLDRGAGVRLPRSEGDPRMSKTRLPEATRGRLRPRGLKRVAKKARSEQSAG